MPYPFALSLKKNVRIEKENDDLLLIGIDSALRFKNPSPGIHAGILSLANRAITEEDLSKVISEKDGTLDWSKFYFYINKIEEKRLFRKTILVGKSPLATLEPISPSFSFVEHELLKEARYRLSRFAYSHLEDGKMVLESPLGHAKVILEDWRANSVLGMFACFCTLDEIYKNFRDLGLENIKALLQLLLNINAISEINEQAKIPEEEDKPLVQWDFHDLLFHSRSRLGRHDNPFGGTFRFLEKIEPLPAIKPSMSDQIIELFRPDMENLEKEDVPFTQVIENRRSIREYGDNPITVKEIGEFLFRTARVIEIRDANPEIGAYYQSTMRPYPGGGAVYELELYLTVNECEGLVKGLYHYNPKDHFLEILSDMNDHLENLLQDAKNSSAMENNPQLLITLAARFQRFAWKYQSMAYSAILKNVGVLYQQMYLAATAMGLAPCGIGGGNSDLFAKASNLNYYEETSVGEFLLGKPK